MSKKSNLNMMLYVSSVMLAVGVFLPLTSFAIIGDVSYNRAAETESYLVVLFAILAVVFQLAKQTKFIFVSVVGVWVTLLFPAIQGLFEADNTSALGKLSSKASGAMQDFAADLFLNIFEFSWGGFVFLAGLIIFTVVGISRAMK